MKLRLILLTLIAACAMASSQASADTIAYVNIDLIMHDSSAGKSVKEQLDTKRQSFKTEMSRKENELNKEQESLAQQRAVLSPDAFEKKAKAFRAKANAAQKDVEAKGNELNSAVNSSLGQIQKAVFEIVSKISKDKGYSVIIPTSALLYADPKLDITNEVMTQLNATLPKVTVNFKAPAASGKDDE